MTDCLFCKIIDGKIPAKKLAESDNAIAIADINPQAPVHALIIPKKHVASLNELTAMDRTELLPALYELADALAKDRGLRESGYRTVINNGESAGQTVFHLHMHVLGGAPMRAGFGA
jgi:histidine triad (HIT) family protein